MKNVRVLTFCLTLLAGALAGIAQADTLKMDATAASASFDQAGKPTRGMTQARVEAGFGEPQSRQSPVGDPPITRWDYDTFAVFFEYDKVIHAVSKRR